MSSRSRGGGPVRIRAGRLADAPAVARVMRAAVRWLPPSACTPRQRAAWSSLPALYHRWAMGPGGERYLVAESGGRVVGYAAYRAPPAPRGAGALSTELTAVFVLPAAGGAGLGRRLVAAVERRARRAGVRAIEVVAARPAVGFYLALGYVRLKSLSAPLPGGQRLPAASMQRRIPNRRSPPPPSAHRGKQGG